MTAAPMTKLFTPPLWIRGLRREYATQALAIMGWTRLRQEKGVNQWPLPARSANLGRICISSDSLEEIRLGSCWERELSYLKNYREQTVKVSPQKESTHARQGYFIRMFEWIAANVLTNVAVA